MGVDHGPPCPLLLLPPYTCGATGAPGRGGSPACPRDAARRAASRSSYWAISSGVQATVPSACQ
eukprot:12431419-Alexandrium_andersonii.AAC.1